MWCFIKKTKFIANCVISKLSNTGILQISLKKTTACQRTAISDQLSHSTRSLKIPPALHVHKQVDKISPYYCSSLGYYTNRMQHNCISFKKKKSFSPHKPFIITKRSWRIWCWKLTATAQIFYFLSRTISLYMFILSLLIGVFTWKIRD